MKIKTIDGNEACANSAYMFSDMAGIYPITPSSTMAELVDEWSSKDVKNIFNMPVKVVEMQSEAGAAGFIHGALSNGSLATTFTSSQGLLLMIPNMYKIAGEMLPGVINVAARSIATHALSILGDHQDIYSIRPTGFAILASSSVQCVSDLTLVSYLSAIDSSLPFVNFFDGFRTSHELSKINVLEKEDIIDLVDFNKINEFRNKGLSVGNRVKGTAMMEDVYFQMAEVRNKDYEKLPDVVNKYMTEINKKTGKNYAPFEYYGSPNATKIIVAMGSVCDTIKEVIDDLKEDIGLIEVHLYRPFSSKYFFNALPKSVKKIAVLDRTKEPGSMGEPLYLDVVSLFNNEESRPYIIGGRYGLSSKDTNPAQIKAVYEFLDSDKSFHNFTIGIEDDVTNLSLPIKKYHPNTNSKEFLIYGYGSDGMVSAAKDILKIVGDNTPLYVQGYFQYDSKKSGGVTRTHIRINDNVIRSTYFIDNPSLVVCSKETYVRKYDMLSNIKKNGTFILVTNQSEKEVNNLLSDEIKRIISTRNIKMYIIDAYKLSNKYGLKNKISTILETCILDIIGYGEYINHIKENIKSRFLKKGNDVINSNLSVVDEALENLHEIKITSDNIEFIEQKDIKYNKVFEVTDDLNGNDLKVSDFLDYKDGSFIMGTSEHEKRNIAENVPVWNIEKCIQCNQCSFVCPHAVIRPFLLDEEEVKNGPKTLKLRNAIGSKYQFTIEISKEDCTGCSLCATTCPANALTMTPIDEVKDNNNFKYLLTTKEKTEQINNTVKGSQFKKPLFEFSGACAGCGETPYIKLLTQLFGDKISIANATGCSSIYGGSFPSIPYKLPWANSLFEDNAEFGYGMLLSYNSNRSKIKEIMESELEGPNKEIFNKWLNNYDDYKITKEVYESIDYTNSKLKDLKQYIIARDIWTVGGDGWAYDIGFGGIDHILSTNDNIKILVLDTEVYSNTGGQSSKSSNRGSIAKFTANGKRNAKKDLARLAMSYPNAYVAQVSMANMNSLVKAFVEADKHDGPAIIIAYSPCINHGIKAGLESGIQEQKLAVNSGYFLLFRYNSKTKEFNLDQKEPDFNLLDKFIDNETRFQALKIVNEEKAKILFDELKEDIKNKYEYYKGLLNK